MDRKVKILGHKRLQTVGNGFLKLDEFKIKFPKFESGEDDERVDTVVNVDRGDSVAGLIHIKREDKHAILLVEQFRLPTLIDADTGLPDLTRIDEKNEEAGRVLELAAGTRKAGEPWLEAFRRECLEETELEPDEVEFITSYYPSPGACSEQIHLYYGRVDWPDNRDWPETDAFDKANHGDETENIRRHFYTPTEFLEKVSHGKIKDGKCFVAAEWMRRAGNPELFGLSS